MSRATIIARVDFPEEVAAAEEWFAKWAGSLSYRSENKGCGCCVHIWDVEGPDEAVVSLPPRIMSHSDWVESGIRKS